MSARWILRRRLVPGAERPVATFSWTHSVEAPSQAYSQSWIVPAPLVARWVNQSTGHHPLENQGGAVAKQMGAVDQHDGRPARRAASIVRAASSTIDSVCSVHGCSGRIGLDQDLVGPRQALALGEGKDLELAQVEWCHAHVRVHVHVR